MCLCFSYYVSAIIDSESGTQNYDCTLKHSRITEFYVSLVTKGHLESPSVFFWKRLDINLDEPV